MVLVVFNRPELTARVLARIRDARPETLFVVADGPRADRPGEVDKCRQVRALIERGIDWPCEVIRDYSDVNLGCGVRPETGIAHAFDLFEEAIILEDDCLPDLTFFRYCSELLDTYRGDARIGQIGGTTFRQGPLPSGESYYWSQYPHCWGWATWRRAWRLYDHSMAGWREVLQERAAAGALSSMREHAYWNHVFAATQDDRLAAWDYRWVVALWKHRCLSAIPSVNLVENIGTGPDATHTVGRSTPGAGAMVFPMRPPASLDRDAGADIEVGRSVFRLPSLADRLARRLRLWMY